MTDDIFKRITYNYGFMKGRLAEAIVERLFITLGWEVYPVGFETKIPRIAQLVSAKKVKTKAIERFEYGPDFVVYNPHESHKEKLHEIEVKFRKNSRISRSDLKHYKHNDDLLFLFLDKENIYCLRNGDKKHIGGKGDIYFHQCELLLSHPAFSFNHEQRRIIRAFPTLLLASLNKFEKDTTVRKDVSRFLQNTKTEIDIRTCFAKASSPHHYR